MKILSKEFDNLFTTINSVEELEKMILDIAIRGKLVPQDPNDEPSSLLLEKIQFEKGQLIKEKKIKKEKPIPSITEEEIPFGLPESWEWVRLGQIGETNTGTTPPTNQSEYFNGEYPFIKPADVTKKGINYENESLSRQGIEKGRLIKKDSVMMVCIGGSIGKSFYTDRDSSCNQQINTITGFCNISSKFLNYFMSSTYFYESVVESASGSATPIINKSKWESIAIPLPPLNEQIRIVNKLDQLMLICSELKDVLAEKKQVLNDICSSALLNVNIATSEDELNKSLAFVISQFELIFDSKESIAELRELILSLATHGKLVPQDPNDEPASVLLENIKAEKEQLIKEKKIKKEKPLLPISDDEIPYELPQGWEWVRLGEASYNHGQKIPDQTFTYIDVGSINKEKGFLSDQLNVLNPEEAPSRARKIVNSGTVIYSTVRPYLLNIAIIDRKFDYEPIVSTAFAVMHPFSQIQVKFLYYYLRSNLFVEYVESQMVGMAYPAINESKLFNGVFPLPPLNDQKRIVEKIEKLLALCDELEKTVEQSKQESEQLMQSVLQEAFSEPEKVNNIVEFPTFDSGHSEEEWDMAARAEDSIAHKTLTKIEAILNEVSSTNNR